MITERFNGYITEPGSFDLPIDSNLAPLDDALLEVKVLDHIVVLPCWVQHPDEFLDADLLAIARYVGPILEIDRDEDEQHIRGQGMSWHLGDSSGIGPVVPVPIDFANASPTTVIDDAATGLLFIGNILPGVITNTGSDGYTITDGHAFQTHRQALDLYLKATLMEARVNPNGTIDATSAGRDEVYVQEPVIIASRDGWGQDPGGLIGVECNRMLVRSDATDWADEYVFVDRATGAVLDQQFSSVSFLDIHGNSSERTFVTDSIPEEFADLTNDGASNFLASEAALRDSFIEVEIDTDMVEMSLGTMSVGDHIFIDSVEDWYVGPDQIHFRGVVRFPRTGRITEGTWPTLDGQGFYHRSNLQDPDGPADQWTDLTPIVIKEYKEGQSFSRLGVKVIPLAEVGC